MQFRGKFTPETELTMLASRSGLVMDPNLASRSAGSRKILAVTPEGGEPAAKLILEVDPKYIKLIPSNVNADIEATTIFRQ